jgi:REP element-mobilizing transposase RayT
MGYVVRADRDVTMKRGEQYGRRSIRLKGYDYARDGAYFVTICTQGRERVFGTVVQGEMRPNECGRQVARCWTWLAEQYPYVHVDEWIVMPDHTHAIIVITDTHGDDGRSNATHPNIATPNATDMYEPCRGGSRTAQLRTASTTDSVIRKADGVHSEPTQRKPLGRLIGAFKTVSTGRVNDLKGTPGAQLWQRNYHERVIRNSLALDALRRYVANNPVLWVPE